MQNESSNPSAAVSRRKFLKSSSIAAASAAAAVNFPAVLHGQASQKFNAVIIGVGGCVASQEGAAIVQRAPYVDLVFGPQTLHRLPELIRNRARTGRPQIDISFPEIEKFDHLPPARVDGCTAFVSIMEGCSKYCSFCVVPYTRGEEVSRPFEDVLTEVADLADRGVREVTLLGQNVNAYRGAMSQGGAPLRRSRW